MAAHSLAALPVAWPNTQRSRRLTLATSGSVPRPCQFCEGALTYAFAARVSPRNRANSRTSSEVHA